MFCEVVLTHSRLGAEYFRIIYVCNVTQHTGHMRGQTTHLEDLERTVETIHREGYICEGCKSEIVAEAYQFADLREAVFEARER